MLSNARELAKALSVSLPLIRKLTRPDRIPVVRIGRSARYDIPAVIAHLQAQQHGNNGNGKAETAEAVTHD